MQNHYEVYELQIHCALVKIAMCFCFFLLLGGMKKKTGSMGLLGSQYKKSNLNANHIQNWFGLVFLAETSFNSFDCDMGPSSFVLSFSIVLSLY